MNFLKSYVRPHGQGKAAPPPVAAPPMEMTASGKTSSTYSHLKSQGSSRPGTRPISRPASPYPEGDFRNADFAGVNAVKCAIALEWLHQEQQKLQIYHATPNEGVVLKKALGEFIACPEFLAGRQYGLFEAASGLNSRVSRESCGAIWTTDELT